MADTACVGVREWDARGRRISMALPTTLGILHLIAVVAWSVPFQSPAENWLNRLDGAYLHLLGLDQRWGMFSYPSTTEEILEFRVICTANSYTWRGDLGGVLRQVGESLFRGGDHQLEIDLARYVAHRAAVSGQKPMEIQILRRWSPIARPGSKVRERRRTQEILSYAVEPQDLQ